MDGIVDTSVVIDAYRGYTLAINWFSANRNLVLAITPMAWMEMVEGAANKTAQQKVIAFLHQFIVV